MNVDEILNERKNTHGDFFTVAQCAQMIKSAINIYGNETISGDKREALDMIASKIGRICSGNSNERDHWLDIAGYATLIANRLEGR